MIDFQDSGLESQVYVLIAKMCDLTMSDDFPKFQTKKLPKKGLWECTLAIPGVEKTAFGRGKTEVESINLCAIAMLKLLKNNYKNNEYNPCDEKSVFCGDIEQFFGDVDYDSGYNYYLHRTDILLTKGRDDNLRRALMKKAIKNSIPYLEKNSEVDMMCDIVTLRFLIRNRKKRYA